MDSLTDFGSLFVATVESTDSLGQEGIKSAWMTSTMSSNEKYDNFVHQFSCFRLGAVCPLPFITGTASVIT